VIQLYKYSDKWIKIGVNVGICLPNDQGNFPLYRFTMSENIVKFFSGGWGATFLTRIGVFGL